MKKLQECSQCSTEEKCYFIHTVDGFVCEPCLKINQTIVEQERAQDYDQIFINNEYQALLKRGKELTKDETIN